MISKSSAPGKIILFGEHFVVYGVKAILASIDKRVFVTSRIIDEKEIRVKSNLGSFTISSLEPYFKIKNSFRPFSFIAKKMIEEFNHEKGIEIEISSDIPTGVGLGSSSACCVATAGSVSGLFTKLSRDEVLKLAIEAEKTIFEQVSGADTTVSTYGGILEFQKEKGFEILDSKNNFYFVIINSKELHSTSKIVAKVRRFSEEHQKIFGSLCEKEARIIEEAKKALRKNDLKLLGRKMTENQKNLEEIGVSNERLNAIINLAEETSYGAKITGAGGGGCIIALTDEYKLEDTLSNLNKFDCFSAKIDQKGLDNF